MQKLFNANEQKKKIVENAKQEKWHKEKTHGKLEYS